MEDWNIPVRSTTYRGCLSPSWVNRLRRKQEERLMTQSRMVTMR